MNVGTQPDTRAERFALLAVALLALLPFLASLGNGFAYDDMPLVLGDARIRSLRAIGAIVTSGYWPDPELALYRPLTTLSLALNYAVAGAQPIAFHLTNIVLHAIATMLVFALLVRFVPIVAAWAGAAVFAVHPVHVESVANVAGRGELLAAVLVLAACVIWLRPAPVGRQHGRAVIVGALFLLALLAKESAIVLPLLLLLLDVTRHELRRDGIADYVRRRATVIALLAVSFGLYVGLRLTALDSVVPVRLDPVLAVVESPLHRVLTALQAWPHFARLLLVPVTLLADYGPGIIRPATSLNPAAATGAFLIVGLLAGSAAAWRANHRVVFVALLWFAIAILPVSSLVLPIGVLVAERTLYLPSVAVTFAVAAGVGALWKREARYRRAAVAAVLVVIALGGVRSAVRVPEWRSTESIFAALLRDRPDSYRAHWIDARRLGLAADTAAAAQAYRRAVAIWPHSPQLGAEATTFAVAARDLPLARELAVRVTNAHPADLRMQRLLAGIALDLADTLTARSAIADGLALDPDDELLRDMQVAAYTRVSP